MAVIKTKVVSVHVEPRIKDVLQSAARRETRSVRNTRELFLAVACCLGRDIPGRGDSPKTLLALGGREKV
jgi:hypothetical protein